MRLAVALTLAVTLGLAAVATQTRVPLKQDLEILTQGHSAWVGTHGCRRGCLGNAP